MGSENANPFGISLLGKITALSVVTLSCVGAWWLGSSWRGARAENGGLTVAPEYLDFGEAWENKAFRWKISIENPTHEDISVLHFATSCTCLSIEPRSLTVPAQGRGEVRLKLDLTPRRAPNPGIMSSHASQSPGAGDCSEEFTAQIVPQLATKLPYQGWILKGRVRRSITPEIRALDFGDSLVRRQPFPSRTIEFSPCIPLEGVTAACDPNFASVQLTPVHGSQARSKLVIQPKENLPPGPFDFNVSIQPRTQGGTELPPIVLAVHGVVTEDIKALPPAVTFGARDLATDVHETVVLRSNSGSPFQVERISLDTKDLMVTRLAASTDGGHIFDVVSHISKKGYSASKVEFHIRYTNDSESLVIPLEVSYYGMSDDAQSPGSPAPRDS